MRRHRHVLRSLGDAVLVAEEGLAATKIAGDLRLQFLPGQGRSVAVHREVDLGVARIDQADCPIGVTELDPAGAANVAHLQGTAKNGLPIAANDVASRYQEVALYGGIEQQVLDRARRAPAGARIVEYNEPQGHRMAGLQLAGMQHRADTGVGTCQGRGSSDRRRVPDPEDVVRSPL